VTGSRPRAATLLPVLVERPGKLTSTAASRALPVRCPRRHLLAAVIRTVYGRWVYRRGDPAGDGWRCDWQADLDTPIVDAWCNCPNTWTVDLAAPGTPPALALD
jgi:hypothetical protein